MSLRKWIGATYFKRFRLQVRDWLENPIHKQTLLLQQILEQTKNTALDEAYGISSIHNYKGFTERLPIVHYENIKPYVDRALAYEANIFQKGYITWFAKSSGTTADKSKFIPTSSSFFKQGHYRASTHLMTQYLEAFPHSNILNGRGLIMGGSHSIYNTHAKIRVGDLSALLLQNASIIRNIYTAPSLDIALLGNWEEKIIRMAAQVKHQNITSISGVPTWTIAFIKYILHQEKKQHLKEVWPNCELYINGGVAFKPYEKILQTLFGKTTRFLEVYNASEGFFAAQSHPEDKEGMLLYTHHGTFYEFLAVEDYRKALFNNTIPLEQVKTGVDYAIIISNLSGLLRYVVGDTISFTSLNPYKLVLTGRLKQFINAVGEEVIVDNTDNAIAYVSKKMNLEVLDYTVAPMLSTEQATAYHEWIIALSSSIEKTEKEAFIMYLDSALQRTNSDYEAKRLNNIGLVKPVVHFVDGAFFTNWMKQKDKLGGQHKVPRLENSRKYMDELLNEIKKA